MCKNRFLKGHPEYLCLMNIHTPEQLGLATFVENTMWLPPPPGVKHTPPEISLPPL